MKTALSKKINIVSFMLLLLLASCTTTHTVSFEVLWPAKVEVPARIKHITLINNTLLPKTDSMGTYYGFQHNLYYDTTRIDTMLSMSALDGLAEELAASDRYSISANPVILPLKDTTFLRKPISFDILALITPAETDGVVVLESMSTYDQLDYELGYDDRVYARLTLLDIASWRFYDLRQRRIIDRWNIIDTLNYYSNGLTTEDAINGLPQRYTSLQQLANEAGKHYGRQISPSWKKLTRTYLSDGSEILEKGRRAATANDWETAAREWLKATDDKNANRASIAALNMAVASEVLGNLEMARYWLNLSLKQKPLPSATSYNTDLKLLEDHLLILQQQFENTQ